MKTNYYNTTQHAYEISEKHGPLECEVTQPGRNLPTFERHLMPLFSGYDDKATWASMVSDVLTGRTEQELWGS